MSILASRHNSPASTALEIEHVQLAFGGISALQDVSCQVNAGEIYAVIGPNGAGKTSLLNLISGIYMSNTGRIRLFGQDITGQDATSIARAGVARTFQNLALFRGLDVAGNVLIGRHTKLRAGVLASGFYFGRAQREERRNLEVVDHALDFLEIAHLRHAAVEALPYGLQKRVEIARAVATEAPLLLLDEPMAGMNQHEKQDIIRIIRLIRKTYGTTIIIIEHDVGVVMNLSDRILVLDHGVGIAEGEPGAIRSNPRVIAAYLGEEDADAPHASARARRDDATVAANG